ncbi:MAG: hypothetical protein ABJP45_13770 [Cyclobacteriaceae bacterium]
MIKQTSKKFTTFSLDKIKGILITPVTTFILLIPYSLLLGKDLLTVGLFWFVITLLIAINAPILVSSRKNHLLKSLTGLLVFYALNGVYDL